MESSAWSQSYADPPANRQPRYADNVLQTNVGAGPGYPQQQQQQQQHKSPPAQQLPPPQTFQTPSSSSYQAYHSSSHHQTPASGSTPAMRGGTGDYMDIQMQDAGDMYRKQYTQPSRQQQPQQPPQASRQTSYLQGDDPSSTQRYSPMNASQPQYTPAGAHQPPASANFSQISSYQQGPRQSPTRPSYSTSQSATSSQAYFSQMDSPRNERPPAGGLQMHGMSSQQQTPSRTMSLNSPPHLPPISVGSTDSAPQRMYSQSSGIPQHTNYEQGPPSPRAVQRHQPPQQEAPPHLVRIGNVQELQPRVNQQPAFRRANPDGGFISPLQALTSNLPSTYRLCNPNFKYESSKNPRRVLTKPSKGVKNDGFDNEDSDYILYVNDTLGSEENGHKNRYLILDVLGQGTFGQVVKCQNLKTQEVVAVKVIKNRTAYFNQSMMEVSVLDLLNSKLDKNDDHHILRLKDTFIHRQHLCLVFELLSVNLYELIKQNQFRGLSTTLVRVFAQQLLHALALLNKANLIHCDLKPENILLKNLESPMIKVIDFGSACDERQTVYTYIQSRFYRSPEVLLGLPYSSAIDMWSLGCIVVELFLGLPLFPGSSEYNQVSRITEMLGVPPAWMIEMGKQSGEFFERIEDEYGRKSYRLKSMEQYSREHNTKEQPSKKYFQATTLPEIIRSYAMPRKNMKPIEIEREMNNRVAFIDFVRGLLNINPLERWSPQQAKLHPFITQQKYTGPFVPPMNVKASQKSPAPGTAQQVAAQAKHQEQELKQRQAQQAQLQQQQQAQAQMQASQFPAGVQGFHQPPVYNNMYNPPQPTTIAPPAYSSSQPTYGQSVLPTHNSQNAMHPTQFAQNNLYAQAATRNAAQRQRASTHVDGVPVTIQKAASLMDPTQPIRLQPSPAYYPPPPEFDANGNRIRKPQNAANNKARANRDLIRNLEDRTLEDGLFNSSNHWAGS